MNPCPFTDQELSEVAVRHRVTVKDLRFRWAYPEHGVKVYASLDDAGAAAYRSRKGLEETSRRWAESYVKRQNALAAEFGLSVTQIREEVERGDWPDDRSAAEHLARSRPQRWKGWWLRLLGG